MVSLWLKIPSVDSLPPEGVRLPNRLLPFLWFFLRQVRRPMAFALACFVLQGVLWASAPFFLKLFIDILGETDDKSQLWEALRGPFLLFFLFILVLQPLANQLGQWIKFKILPEFINMIRRQLSLYVQGHSYRYYQDDFAGRLASKVVETPFAVHAVIDIIMGPFLVMAVIFAVFMGLFAMTHYSLLILMLIWLAGYILWMVLILPKILKKSKIASDELSVMRGRYVDILSNILQVKLFSRNDHEDRYFLESLRKNKEKYWHLYLQIFTLNNGLQLLNPVFWVAVMLTSFVLWQDDKISTGDVAMILPMLINMRNLTWWVSDSAAVFFQNLGQIEEGMETISKAQDVQNKEHAPDLTVSSGAIHIKNLHFAYEKSKVFEGLDIEIPAGQKIGLIGPSGAGKSSLVQLLLRLYDIDEGQILIDGQNIADVRQESLREQIAVIPQMNDLLHRSIRENIGYGNLDATDEDIHEAARRAYVDEFIQTLEDNNGNTGYDVHVGERGVKLSGGQRQRIAIARALLKDAPILILDEATSALDSESEKLIQASFKDLMKDKTVIAIAHRLSTISHLDRLIVMDQGRIIEDGTHEDLLKKKGLYAKLWKMQSGGFLGE